MRDDMHASPVVHAARGEGVKGGIPDPFDGRGSGQAGPSGFAVLAWAGVAGIALVMALVAMQYGLPDRNPETAARSAERALPPDPMPTGSLDDRFAGPAFSDPGGRTDVPGTFDGGGGDLAAEIARLRVENAALRQGTDAMRGQMDMLTERLERLEAKLGELTGSIDRRAPAPPVRQAPAPSPEVPLERADREVARSNEGGVAHTRFGVELGVYPDLTALKAAWRTLLETRPELFGDLEALATVRDRGGRTELLLVAGPFPNAADAASRCAQVEQAGIACLPAFYLGQALAIR
jgi:hypothetical protein